MNCSDHVILIRRQWPYWSTFYPYFPIVLRPGRPEFSEHRRIIISPVSMQISAYADPLRRESMVAIILSFFNCFSMNCPDKGYLVGRLWSDWFSFYPRFLIVLRPGKPEFCDRNMVPHRDDRLLSPDQGYFGKSKNNHLTYQHADFYIGESLWKEPKLASFF